MRPEPLAERRRAQTRLFLFVDNECRFQTNFLTVCAMLIKRRDGPPLPNEGPLSGRIAVMLALKPGTRPANPNFSSGPCAKRPNWSLDALKDAPLGRSHRAKVGKNKLKLAIDLTREVQIGRAHV